MKRYVYYQPNQLDLSDSTNDCVVRALCKVLGCSWKIAFNHLCEIGLQEQKMPNDKEVYEKVLSKFGFQYVGISNKKGSKRPTVESFSKDNPSGIYFLNLANHVVAVEDGKYYDTWDCGNKCLYGYYERLGGLNGI